MNADTQRLGLVKTSLIDFPGRVSAVIFTSGCNFHCPFCHNPDLAKGISPASFVSHDEVLAHLQRRRRVLDGVVITGGEPLLCDDLPDLVRQIRDFDLLVKIDTNGSFPERLEAILPDFVALDIKCAPDRYGILSSIDDAVARLESTIRIVKEYKIAHEFRTTVVPGLVDVDGFGAILEVVRGADRFVLNEFRSERTLDPRLSHTVPYTKRIYEQLKQMAEDAGIRCVLRGPSFSR